MSAIGERVREIRKSDKVNLTLEKFGEKIGLKKNSISQIENGVNALTDQMKLAICREFHVNQDWLETGEGDMFLQRDVEDEIASLIAKIPNEPRGSFKRKLLSVLAGLSEDQWVMLADIAEKLAEKEADD